MSKCCSTEAKATGPRPQSWERWLRRPCPNHSVTLPPMTQSRLCTQHSWGAGLRTKHFPRDDLSAFPHLPSVYTHLDEVPPPGSWPCHMACGILVPQPGIESVPPPLEAWSLNHWTTKSQGAYFKNKEPDIQRRAVPSVTQLVQDKPGHRCRPRDSKALSCKDSQPHTQMPHVLNLYPA